MPGAACASVCVCVRVCVRVCPLQGQLRGLAVPRGKAEMKPRLGLQMPRRSAPTILNTYAIHNLMNAATRC